MNSFTALLLLILVQSPELISRTEYSARIENFFQFQPLYAGKPSQFRIEPKDVSDFTPIEAAQITLTVRRVGSRQAVTVATSKPDKTKGVYLAQVTVATPGKYSIEFRIRNAKFDERMLVDLFDVD